jgi:hypothetical protein
VSAESLPQRAASFDSLVVLAPSVLGSDSGSGGAARVVVGVVQADPLRSQASELYAWDMASGATGSCKRHEPIAMLHQMV